MRLFYEYWLILEWLLFKSFSWNKSSYLYSNEQKFEKISDFTSGWNVIVLSALLERVENIFDLIYGLIPGHHILNKNVFYTFK